MIRCYFAVEGPHEIEVIGHLLKRRGLRRVTLKGILDTQFQALVPTAYPAPDGDILRRVDTPSFFQSSTHCVAIDSAIGVDNLSGRVKARRTRISELHSVGILADADGDALSRRREIVAKLPELDFGDELGGVAGQDPRAGIFVLPDNSSPGSLENILLHCAGTVYPRLLEGARKFIDPIDATDTNIFVDKDESRDFRKPFGKSKAIVACVSSVLRPGRAIQVSIQDNRWFREPQVLADPLVKNLQDFVDAILGSAPDASAEPPTAT